MSVADVSNQERALGRHVSEEHPHQRLGREHSHGQFENRHPIRLSKYLANLATQTGIDSKEDMELSTISQQSHQHESSTTSQPTHWPIDLNNSLIRAV